MANQSFAPAANDATEGPRKSVQEWATAKGLSAGPYDPSSGRGDFFTFNPARLEGAIAHEVARKRWPARRAELVTEAEFDQAIADFDGITLG